MQPLVCHCLVLHVLQTMVWGDHRPWCGVTTYLHNLPKQTGLGFLPECWCSHLDCAQGREKHPLGFLFNTLLTFQYVKRDGGAMLSSKCGCTRREKREITVNKEQIC